MQPLCASTIDQRRARSCGYSSEARRMQKSRKVPLAVRKDPLTPEQRASAMRRVRRKDTGPELALRRERTRRGIRYRVDCARAPGRRDVAIVGRRVAVFVDGEFWHGKRLSAERLAEMPEYWRRKIARNVERDAQVNDALRARGWRVVRATDRVIIRDLPGVADVVERTAMGHPVSNAPNGVEVHGRNP